MLLNVFFPFLSRRFLQVLDFIDFIDDFVKPEFERVPGVAASGIFGGREREMRVVVDPAKLAARQVTMGQIAAALDRIEATENSLRAFAHLDEADFQKVQLDDELRTVISLLPRLHHAK